MLEYQSKSEMVDLNKDKNEYDDVNVNWLKNLLNEMHVKFLRPYLINMSFKEDIIDQKARTSDELKNRR